MKPVVFDSSFLISVAEHPTGWHESITELVGGFEPVALDCVLEELNSISEEAGKRGRFARLAITMAEKFRRVGCGGADVDSEILSYAVANSAMVATIDGEMLRALNRQGVGCVTLHGGRVALA
ncbi:MAG TPA: hypothetical protein VEJ36_08160 [Nitrososphaerales archaeon]|nr:hypothetical protein [Nitrososphaerales archaeon]